MRSLAAIFHLCLMSVFTKCSWLDELCEFEQHQQGFWLYNMEAILFYCFSCGSIIPSKDFIQQKSQEVGGVQMLCLIPSVFG